MKLRLLYIYLAFAVLAISGNCYGAVAERSSLSVEPKAMPTECQHSIVKIAEHSSSPFSKAGQKDGSTGTSIFVSSEAVPHASITTISPLTFAVAISLLNNDKHDREPFVTTPATLALFHKILFRAIISPNAP